MGESSIPIPSVDRGNGPTEEAVREALGTVIDPEIGVSIVDLGLVYGVGVEDGRVAVEMTTTSAVCPLGEYLTRAVEGAVAGIWGVRSVTVEVTNEPPWTADRMSEKARAMLGWEK